MSRHEVDDRSGAAHGRFEAFTSTAPDACALVIEPTTGTTRRFSHGELNQWANQLAHARIALGARPGEIVGICLPRSEDPIVTGRRPRTRRASRDP